MLLTDTWIEDEHISFKILISKGLVDGVMTGHLFDRNVDSNYPATISEKHVSRNLRDSLGFNGLVFTDDLQMGAIKKYYNLVEATKLAINNGTDVLLFADFYLLTKEEQDEILRQRG